MENIGEQFWNGGYMWPGINGNNGRMKDISSLKSMWDHNCDCGELMDVIISVIMALMAVLMVLAFTSRRSH